MPKWIINLVNGIISDVDKTLESIQVPPIASYHGARVASLVIHRWQISPFVVKDIEFLTISNHLLRLITASDHIDKPVFEIVVCSERSPPGLYRLQVFNLVGE